MTTPSPFVEHPELEPHEYTTPPPPSVVSRIEKASIPVNFNADGSPISGQQVMDIIRQYQDAVLLDFSLGKDSLAAWLTLREAGFKVIPFYMYRVPGLAYTQRIIDYYQDYFKTEILQIPNPDLYHMLMRLAYQPPQNCAVIEAAELPSDIGYDTIMDATREWLGLPYNFFVATGSRAVDNIERGMSVRKHGPINWSRQIFWPVWDLRKDDLIALFHKHHVRLTVEYKWYGHSLGGMDYRYLQAIHDNVPDDWQRVLDYFPLAWLELARYNEVGKWKEQYIGTQENPDSEDDDAGEYDGGAGDS